MGRFVRALGGSLLFAAALALSFPGVTPVRAETAPVATAPTLDEGPMCRANAPLTPPAVVDGVAAQIDARARAEAVPGAPQVRVLNGRGYRYDPARVRVDLQDIAQEVVLERRRQAQ
jgi:hypothetical protein